MRCPDCHGIGYVLRRSFPGNELFPYPCETCGGCGFSHCCQGENVDRATPSPTPAGYRQTCGRHRPSHPAEAGERRGRQ
jgi:DnaJ-class molecular chaperone